MAKKKGNLPRNPDGSVKAGPGRPKGSKKKWKFAENDFAEAMKYVEKSKNKPFLVHLIEQAYLDRRVAVAIAKKILPDLKSIEMDLGTSGEIKDLLDVITHRTDGRRSLPKDEDD